MRKFDVAYNPPLPDSGERRKTPDEWMSWLKGLGRFVQRVMEITPFVRDAWDVWRGER